MEYELMSNLDNYCQKHFINLLQAARNQFILASWQKYYKMLNLQINFILLSKSLESFKRKLQHFKNFMLIIQVLQGFYHGFSSIKMGFHQQMILHLECQLLTMVKCSGVHLHWVTYGNRNIQMFYRNLD